MENPPFILHYEVLLSKAFEGWKIHYRSKRKFILLQIKALDYYESSLLEKAFFAIISQKKKSNNSEGKENFCIFQNSILNSEMEMAVSPKSEVLKFPISAFHSKRNYDEISNFRIPMSEIQDHPKFTANFEEIQLSIKARFFRYWIENAASNFQIRKFVNFKMLEKAFRGFKSR